MATIKPERFKSMLINAKNSYIGKETLSDQKFYL